MNNSDMPKHGTIYYFCPDVKVPSAGIRRLQRHTALLYQAGFNVSLLYEYQNFQTASFHVPATSLDDIKQDDTTIFVIPEGMPRIMHHLKDHPGRRFAIALSWHYIFGTLPDGLNWRHFNIERALVVSPEISRLISWSLGIPVHVIGSSIDHQLYYFPREDKRPQIAYIRRKSRKMEELKRMLYARNPDYINKINWVELEGLSEAEYAAQIRRSTIFLTTSLAEGFPTCCLEAMAAGAVVAGYRALGGRGILRGDGPDQNCILAPNGDYVTLAYKLVPLLDDMIQSKMDNWNALITRAQRTTSAYTVESEACSLIDFWYRFGTKQKPVADRYPWEICSRRACHPGHRGACESRGSLQVL